MATYKVPQDVEAEDKLLPQDYAPHTVGRRGGYVYIILTDILMPLR